MKLTALLFSLLSISAFADLPSIATSSSVTCFLSKDFEAHCGSNFALNNLRHSYLEGKYKSVAVGGEFFCGITLDRSLECDYLTNSNYGDNQGFLNGIYKKLEGHKLKKFQLAGHNYCALTTDDDLLCSKKLKFGKNIKKALDIRMKGFHSCLIDNKEALHCIPSVTKPGELTDEKEILLKDIKDVKFKSIALGQEFGCALSREGKAYCFGETRTKEYGFRSDEESWRTYDWPVLYKKIENLRFEDISIGHRAICGTLKDGKVFCDTTNKKQLKWYKSNLRKAKKAVVLDGSICLVLKDDKLICHSYDEAYKPISDKEIYLPIPNITMDFLLNSYDKKLRKIGYILKKYRYSVNNFDYISTLIGNKIFQNYNKAKSKVIANSFAKQVALNKTQLSSNLVFNTNIQTDNLFKEVFIQVYEDLYDAKVSKFSSYKRSLSTKEMEAFRNEVLLTSYKPLNGSLSKKDIPSFEVLDLIQGYFRDRKN